MTQILENIKEGIFYFFALIASVFSIVTSDNDYKVYTTEERIEYVSDNLEKFNSLAEYAFEYTDGGSPLDTIYDYDIERRSGEDFSEISTKIDERITVHHKNDNAYVKIDFISGTPGYSSSGIYYTEEEIYMAPASGYEAEYDAETGKHIVYNNANSVEIIKITDHWYFYQTAYYNDEGFSTKQ